MTVSFHNQLLEFDFNSDLNKNLIFSFERAALINFIESDLIKPIINKISKSIQDFILDCLKHDTEENLEWKYINLHFESNSIHYNRQIYIRNDLNRIDSLLSIMLEHFLIDLCNILEKIKIFKLKNNDIYDKTVQLSMPNFNISFDPIIQNELLNTNFE